MFLTNLAVLSSRHWVITNFVIQRFKGKLLSLYNLKSLFEHWYRKHLVLTKLNFRSRIDINSVHVTNTKIHQVLLNVHFCSCTFTWVIFHYTRSCMSMTSALVCHSLLSQLWVHKVAKMSQTDEHGFRRSKLQSILVCYCVCPKGVYWL